MPCPTLPHDPQLLNPSAPPVPDPLMLGIEVTVPALAAACGLGNIDPQHTPGARADAPAAVEAALDWPLPPEGARLATIRPDLDALGAMAVLGLRAQGVAPAALQARARRIAAVDRHDRGPWPGPRPLPETLDDLLEDWPGRDLSLLAACMGDAALPMAARVAAMADWLLTGRAPESHAAAVQARWKGLAESLAMQTTLIECSPCGRFATVVSLQPGALALGYRLAPISVALNTAFGFPDGKRGRKYTLARWGEGDGDLDAIVRLVSQRESGWGGQRGIKGSPQSHPSALCLREIRALVRDGLNSSEV